MPGAIGAVGSGSRETSQGDRALAFGESGAGIFPCGNRQQLAEALSVEAQGKWTRHLQPAEIMLEYASVCAGEAARENST